jgi:hypothetical protein
LTRLKSFDIQVYEDVINQNQTGRRDFRFSIRLIISIK